MVVPRGQSAPKPEMATPDRSIVLQLSLLLKQGKINNQLQGVRKRIQARRKVILLICMSSIQVLCADFLVPNPRRLWMHSRSTQWWEDVVLNNFGPHDWMENFGMSRDTFQYLCDQLKPLIQKQDTRTRRSVSTERQVAITLWVLATPAEYRSVAHLFGLARCTVCKIVNETCRAIVQKLLPVYIRFPSGNSLADAVRGFMESLAFHNVLVLSMAHMYL